MQLALPVFGFMSDLEVWVLCYVVQKNCQMPTDSPKRDHFWASLDRRQRAVL